MNESWQYLGTYSYKDEFPYPYWVMEEKQFDVTTLRFNEVAVDPADYTAIKFCARHESNKGDFDDHTKDDIYANLTSDGGGVYHYEWAADQLDKVGKWEVRLEFERAGDSKKFHSKETWYFIVERKMPGVYGDL
jgi:hypothetical protein